ncbi:MAG: choice-of-anchor D domain-containing protein, partial [candidate division KSB1 bacterium]|nr:choice-of-anchor D domain-containing protein [candidate division KSB1 bacterium]
MTKSPKGINRYFISASFIILLLLGQQAARGQTNQWTKLKSEGMYSAYARALVLDLHDQDVIYVGLKGGGIYKSTNGGDFWSEHNNGLLNKDILSLAIHPTNSQILYAGTEQGLFRSNDGANSWERLNFPVCHVNSIAFHPSNSDIIYAATGKLYGKGETLFGLWFSSDAGETWKKTILHDQRLPGIPGDEYFIYPFNASQGQPDRVFVGTIHGIWFDNTQNCDFGFRSHNNDLWTERVYAILANPQDPKFLYAGTLRGLRKGEIKDADSSYWADTDFMLANMSITSLAADDSFLYIGTEKRGIYKTKLSNDIWSLRNCDSITTGNIDTVYTIHASKSPNSTIYFTCSKGIFKKTGNQDFEIKNNGIKCAQINGFVFDEKNQLFYVGTQDGAYKGTKGSDNVINWNKIDGLPDKQVTVFKIDPQNSDILYAIVRSDGIYKSTNKGISWRKETSGEQNILSILITYKNNMAIVFYGSDKGLFKLGTASPIATTNAAVSVIAADPLQPETLYVGTLGNGIFKSRNCGDTWEKIKDPIISFTNINCISVSSKNPDLILCGTNQGIYKSSDAGSTWRKIEDPLVKYLKINDLCFHPRYPKVLLAASERGGIFISRDEAESWRDLNDSLENFNVLCLAATTDGQTTTFYAGTEGNSIFYLNLCDPVIQVQPQMLVFRDTDIGDSTYRSFTIKNIGQDLLTVKSIRSESPIFKVSFQTQQILPNDSISIIITFKPVQPITYEGSLTIESNDPKNPQLPIKLIGKGGIPRLIVASEHDFGKVRITKPTQWIMKIKNVGTDTLKITAIESTHPDVFWAEPNTNISILPDSVFSDTIIFKPNSIGSFNDTLTIKTAAWGEKKVTLLGKGVAPKMAISEHEIQLGAVKVSETIQREFALANSGEDVLSIDSMKFTMADSIFSIFPYSIKIPPSDSIKAKLTFSADTLKEYRNELLIFSDSYDGNDFQDTARISIAGTGVAPRIQVSSVGIHFPDVPAGNQLSDCLQVKNAGSYPLRFLCRGIDTTEFCANPPSGSIGINESLDIK